MLTREQVRGIALLTAVRLSSLDQAVWFGMAQRPRRGLPLEMG
jgi:hypothetical protein